MLDVETKRLEPRPVLSGRGLNGNVYSVLGAATKTLRAAGRIDLARQLQEEAFHQAHSYNEVLALVQCYVEIVL